MAPVVSARGAVDQQPPDAMGAQFAECDPLAAVGLGPPSCRRIVVWMVAGFAHF